MKAVLYRALRFLCICQMNGAVFTCTDTHILATHTVYRLFFLRAEHVTRYVGWLWLKCIVEMYQWTFIAWMLAVGIKAFAMTVCIHCCILDVHKINVYLECCRWIYSTNRTYEKPINNCCGQRFSKLFSFESIQFSKQESVQKICLCMPQQYMATGAGSAMHKSESSN